MSSLWQLTATELASGLRNGEFTAVEILESVLERCDELNPRINAIVEDLRESALETAAEQDRKAARGEWAGPLHGIPVSIKINVDLEGSATNNGVPGLADATVSEDAPIVQHLRKAGAVIFGRNNAPELSMRATTVNPIYGRTVNPWHEEASPGGSSGGAGAAAAAGMGPMHHGNDIGGSLRFPSYACGVTSLKPTNGRVPAYNPSATAERGLLAQLMSVQGVICRSSDDVKLGLKVMSQEDPRDPWWVPAPFDTWPDGDKPRVGMTTETYGYPMHPDIRNAVYKARDVLKDGGYEVEEVDTPSMLDAAEGWLKIAVYELQATLGPVVDSLGSEDLRNIFNWYYDLGPMTDLEGYFAGMAARTAQTRAWNELLNDYPLVLSPYLMRPTYTWNYDAQGYEQTRDLFQSATYSTGVNFLSLPAGVVPAGRVESLPTGVQVIGKRYREDLILDAMACLEQGLGVLYPTLWDTL